MFVCVLFTLLTDRASITPYAVSIYDAVASQLGLQTVGDTDFGERKRDSLSPLPPTNPSTQAPKNAADCTVGPERIAK